MKFTLQIRTNGHVAHAIGPSPMFYRKKSISRPCGVDLETRVRGQKRGMTCGFGRSTIFVWQIMYREKEVGIWRARRTSACKSKSIALFDSKILENLRQCHGCRFRSPQFDSPSDTARISPVTPFPPLNSTRSFQCDSATNAASTANAIFLVHLRESIVAYPPGTADCRAS
jgi:hypothetical protein